MTGEHPYEVLAELAERSERAARDLPPQENAQTHWTGIGFSLLGQRFVASMEEVAELMRVPPVTRIPGVRNFVLGIANVRGQLMSLLDLAVFFGEPSGLPKAQRRVLAYQMDEMLVGFIVDESLGMQHFPSHSYCEDSQTPDERFRPYIRGSYRTAGTEWPIFSLVAFASNPNLEQLAATVDQE